MKLIISLCEIATPKKKKYPWTGIFGDIIVWGIAVGQFGHGWVFFTFSNDLNKYMDEILGFNIKNNGLLSSIPWLAMWVTSIFSGLLSDWLLREKNIRIITLRRWFTVFGTNFSFLSTGVYIFVFSWLTYVHAYSFGYCPNKILKANSS